MSGDERESANKIDCFYRVGIYMIVDWYGQHMDDDGGHGGGKYTIYIFARFSFPFDDAHFNFRRSFCLVNERISQ